MSCKIWIMSFDIRGEEVVVPLGQRGVDLAITLATCPDLKGQLNPEDVRTWRGEEDNADGER